MKILSNNTIDLCNIQKSLNRMNWKLFISLLIMGLCPAIYTTVRPLFLGQMPNEWAYSIAGQLSWVNLLYEIADEAIILPLFFFLGEALNYSLLTLMAFEEGNSHFKENSLLP